MTNHTDDDLLGAMRAEKTDALHAFDGLYRALELLGPDWRPDIQEAFERMRMSYSPGRGLDDLEVDQLTDWVLAAASAFRTSANV